MAAGVDIPGIVLPGDIRPEYYPDTLWFIQQYYVNQFPLISRAKRAPVGSQVFAVRHTKYRPRAYPVGSAMEATATGSTVTVGSQLYTTLTLTNQPNRQANLGDATSLMAGDVLEFVTAGGAVERVEVTATPTMDPGAIPTLPSGISRPAIGTVIVKRGVEGTTVVAHATTDPSGTLVGNSRNGGEVNQMGIRARPIEQDQYVQNFQYPVNIGGAVESTNAYGLQPGSQFQLTKEQQRDNMMRDMEYSSWYGIGEGPLVDGSGNPLDNRLKQIGIANQVVTNKITPTNPSAYTKQNFIQDVLEPLWAVGSAPDIIMGSASFLAGLTTWTANATRIDIGQTRMGLRIDAFESNLAPGLMIVPTISLKPGDIFVGMSELIFWRVKYGESFWPRGTRGYAYEGDWVAEGAIELRDQEKHAFLSGVTAFSPN